MMAYKVLDNIYFGKEVPLYNNGQMHRDWSFVEDIAAGVVAAHSKMSHTTARVSMPLFLNLAASSKLPAVHEPHMPTPVMATCTSLAISSISDSGAGAVPTGLIHTLIWSPGSSARNTLANSSIKV